MINRLGNEHPVSELCELLGVARSGYYLWLERKQTMRSAQNRFLSQQIKAVFSEHRGTYGSRRVTQVLRRQGQCCNHKRVERLMREQGLKGRTGRRRKVRTTNSIHDQPIAPNLLLDRVAPSQVDEVWVADITYIPTAEGWLFLAAVMDLYSRQIIGWSLWDSLAADIALQALARAWVHRGRPRGVIHHSDRGIQYASRNYREELRRKGLVASMSRKGNCYDNAAMEAFWSTLKRESLGESQQWSKDRVRRELFEYIEATYNRKRLHSSLGYRSPLEFENQNN